MLQRHVSVGILKEITQIETQVVNDQNIDTNTMSST